MWRWSTVPFLHLTFCLSGMMVIAWWPWCRFIHFPSASAEEAIALGRKAAAVVSARFPPAMELKFEAVCCPFLLLHVNRRAPFRHLLFLWALYEIMDAYMPILIAAHRRQHLCLQARPLLCQTAWPMCSAIDAGS